MDKSIKKVIWKNTDAKNKGLEQIELFEMYLVCIKIKKQLRKFLNCLIFK